MAALAVCLLCSDIAGARFVGSAHGREIYVDAEGVQGNGLSADRPLRSIAAALKMANKGEVINVAPGTYREILIVTKSNIRIVGSFTADNVPLVRVVAPEKQQGPVLTDSSNTVWNGVAFVGKAGQLVSLKSFSGRFEHCSFDLSRDAADLGIYGGNPTFVSCSFLGTRKHISMINIYGEKKNNGGGTASFAYCLFKDFAEGAFFIRGRQDLDFVNCLFANCGYVLLRPEETRSLISLTNSIFYLSRSPTLVLQHNEATKLKVEHCLYTPALGPFLTWKAKSLEQQPELDCNNCVTASPRFSGGNDVYLNLGIDDAANVPLWQRLTEHAAQYEVPLTIFGEVTAMKQEDWDAVAPLLEQGHEYASHGAVHASLLAKHVIRAGYSEKNAPAKVTIDADKHMLVTTEGREILRMDLNGPTRPTLKDVVYSMQEAGLQAELSDLSFQQIPARCLDGTDNQEISFKAYSPALTLDTNAYLDFMMDTSQVRLDSALTANNAGVRHCRALACPFSENSLDLGEKFSKNGFVVARSNGPVPYEPGLENVNLYMIPDASLKRLKNNMPATSTVETLRILFDFFKYKGGLVTLYSHGHLEYNESEWTALFSLVSKDPLLHPMNLTRFADEMDRRCERTGTGMYQCPPPSGPYSGSLMFVPQPDSPLLEAGKPHEYGANFFGQTIPLDKRPNIGLY